MEVFADRVRIGGIDVISPTYVDETITLPSPGFIGELAVVFTNDSNAGSCDHNLYVNNIKLSSGVVISSSDTAHVLYDKMSSSDILTAFDGANVAAASEAMPLNGGLRFFVGASGPLVKPGGAASPIFSTKSRATRFTNSEFNKWEPTGESITLTAPPSQLGRYRISLRQMISSQTTGMAYCALTLTASTDSAGLPSVQSLGWLYGNPTYGHWQTLFGEGYFEVPAGQTVQLNVTMNTGGNGICLLANSTTDGTGYSLVTAWPL